MLHNNWSHDEFDYYRNYFCSHILQVLTSTINWLHRGLLTALGYVQTASIFNFNIYI